jgi:hypothetical protein
MTQFLAFALYICLGACLLIVLPVLMMPGMSMRNKLLICSITFIVLVPGGLALYAYLGAPPMALEQPTNR